MADGDIKSAPARQKFGQGFLAGVWYFAARSSSSLRASCNGLSCSGEPILLGRNQAGRVYGLRDICPHRATPLSAGRLTRGSRWRGKRRMPLSRLALPHRRRRVLGHSVSGRWPGRGEQRIKVRRWPVAESQGLVFIWWQSGNEPDQPPPVHRRHCRRRSQDRRCHGFRHPYRSRRHRPDGPVARALCPSAMVVAIGPIPSTPRKSASNRREAGFSMVRHTANQRIPRAYSHPRRRAS